MHLMLIGKVGFVRGTSLLLLLVFLGLSLAPAFGQDATPAATEVAAAAPSAPAAEPWKPDLGDQAWVLTSTALVLLMSPGLAFFYGGLVRRKNVLSVLMQCFMCMCMVTILWVVVGFSLAFGSDVAGGFCGNPMDFFMLKGIAFDQAWEPVTGFKSTISQQTFMIFQCMFAIITPGLIIGAFAERMKFSAFMLFTGLWVLVVYCPICHWVWFGPSGFFGLGSFDAEATSVGALDFAGGTVVHINAGIAALVACLVIGKRKGFPREISPPHNLPFAFLGAGLLWFGWFGFNGGSAISSGAFAVRAFVVTQVAAAAAGFAWSMIELIRNGRPTGLGMITGAVAGLVAITPASGFVDVWAALIIGAGATLVSYIFVAFIKPKLGIDDSLDVFGVHGMSGIWGAIATGIFAIQGFGFEKKGGLIEGNSQQVVLQLIAVAYTLVYSGVVTFILLKVIDVVVGLRATLENESIGLDLTDHAEAAYTVGD